MTPSSPFTLVGLRADGVSLTVDFVPEGDLSKALVEAQTFMASHDSCAAVEIWADGVLLARVPEAVRA